MHQAPRAHASALNCCDSFMEAEDNRRKEKSGASCSGLAGATLLGSVLIGSSASPQASPASAASSTVAAFGQNSISLAPRAECIQHHRKHVCAYVDPRSFHNGSKSQICARQGRFEPVARPHQINSVTSQGAGYVVDGELVL